MLRELLPGWVAQLRLTHRAARRLGPPTAALALAAGAFGHSGQLPQIRPAWTHAVPTGLEWFRALALDGELQAAATQPGASRTDGATPRVIVVVDSTGGVTVLHARDGSALWPAVRPFGAGVRLAEPPLLLPSARTPDAAPRPSAPASPIGLCVFNSESLGVIEVVGGGLRWRVAGSSYAPGWARDEDPEFRSRIVAAAAVHDGVLAVRDDGAAVLLDARDGRPRWTARVPPRGDYVLHAGADRAALVSGQTGETTLVSIEWASGTPEVRCAAPLPWSASWSALLADGSVVLAGAERVARADPEGVAFDVLIPGGLLTASMRRIAHGSTERLVFADLGGAVRAMDARDGRSAWGPVRVAPAEGAESATRGQSAGVALHAAGPWIVAGTTAPRVLRASDGGEVRAKVERGSPTAAFARAGRLAIVTACSDGAADRLTLSRYAAPPEPVMGRGEELRRVARDELWTELGATPDRIEVGAGLLLAARRERLVCLRLPE